MKFRIACVLVGFFSLALSLVPLTVAQTTIETPSALPRLVRFSGTVRDLNGNPLTGVAGITFALYSDQTDGAALWLETQNVTADANGHYVALLGSSKPDGLPTELFITEQARWVGVQISGQAEQPRVLLVSAPYAFKAGDAETLGGLPPSAFVLNAPVSSGRTNNGAPSSASSSPATHAASSDVTTTGGTVNTIPLFTTATSIQNSILTQTGTTAVSAAGDLTATGIVTGSSFQIGSKLFAFGTFGTHNAFLGFAGNSKITGLFNTATGVDALQFITNGKGNTASGAWALQNNTAGFFNTATGEAALQANTTGSQNTANGQGALNANTTGGTNTASGYQALLNNTTGVSNTANGEIALLNNTTGQYNTANGAGALLANKTGSNNIAIGHDAAIDVTGGGSNNIIIGNNGAISDNGLIRIGTAGTQTSAFVAGIYGVKTSSNNAVPVLIDSNGNLGTVSSSRRYKEDIQDMGEASAGLMRLRPVTFRYKTLFADGSQPTQYGLIAEEVAEVYPDMVARSADGQIETVKYQLLDPMLLNEVQRQQNEIRDQQSEISDLQERVSKLEATLAAVARTSESR